MDFPNGPYLWKRLSRKTVIDTPWIEVVKDKAVNPSGAEQTYTHVKFKNKAIGIVPYEDGHIWMVGQSRYPLDLYSWEIPEGGCPAGEDTLDTARRELLEETGLSAQTYTPLFQMHLSNSCTDEIATVYLATGLSMGQSAPEACEDITVKKAKLDDVYAAIESGQITDAMTVAGIYKIMLMRAAGTVS